MSIAPCNLQYCQDYAAPGYVDAQVKSALTPAEAAAFGELEAAAGELDLNEEQRAWLTETTLCRYLRARKWDVPKSMKMLQDTLKWRRETRPQDLSYETVKDQADHRSSVVHGYDSVGHPFVYLRVSRDPPGDAKQKLDNVIHSLEESLRQMDEVSSIFKGVERIIYVIDLKGFSMKNSGRDMTVSKEWLSVLGSHMPERLHRAYLLNYPMAFRVFWGLIKAFMDPVTKAKVRWVSQSTWDDRRNYFISEGIEPLWFDKEYGGDLEMPDYCSVVDNAVYKRFFDRVKPASSPLFWAMLAGAAAITSAASLSAADAAASPTAAAGLHKAPLSTSRPGSLSPSHHHRAHDTLHSRPGSPSCLSAHRHGDESSSHHHHTDDDVFFTMVEDGASSDDGVSDGEPHGGGVQAAAGGGGVAGEGAAGGGVAPATPPRATPASSCNTLGTQQSATPASVERSTMYRKESSQTISIRVRRPQGDIVKVEVQETCTAVSLVRTVMMDETARMTVFRKGKAMGDSDLVATVPLGTTLEIHSSSGCCCVQ